jgi:hypothetical protein
MTSDAPEYGTTYVFLVVENYDRQPPIGVIHLLICHSGRHIGRFFAAKSMNGGRREIVKLVLGDTFAD